ncbi:uncharacterized protein PG998_005654 [Apiospora kogelbergensis]|uniref:uncharacterized protein n=1 Tax=Apiospora kogelbergensis TaxID=1337665 RepID=UPI00313126B4
MLIQSLVAALTTGLVLEAAANPMAVQRGRSPSPLSLKKREVPATHNLHERHVPRLGRQWTKRAKVHSRTMLPMRIGLKQSNLDAGHDRLMEISNPQSANYGKHMSSTEVIDFFAPQQSSANTVVDWVVASGIPRGRVSQSANKQWIQFDATTAEAENLLYAEFHVWQHSDGTHDISTESYHVPSHVQEHIDYVTPGTRLRTRSTGGKDSKRKRSLKDGNIVRPQITKLPGFPHPNATTCDIYVTAECTRVQYNVPNGTTSHPGNELGIFESLDDHYSRNDLDVFFSTLYPHLNIPKGTYPEERLVDGAVGALEEPSPYPIEPGSESALDFDAAWPLIWPQKTVLYQVDDEYYEHSSNFSGFWNTFLDAIDGSYCTYSAFGETGDCTEPRCRDPAYPDPNPGGYTGQLQCGVYKPTNVISISYGGDEWAWPDYYMRRQCSEWMKLALQGTTIVISSGDDGVGREATCPTGGNNQTVVFNPDFAATCPYVLTRLREVATERFPSGGGFSNVFPTPKYQRDAVRHYVETVGPSLPFKSYGEFPRDGNFANITAGKGVYNRLGRAYPDVAAVGDRQVVYTGGSWYLIGGTSLSAPVWGALLTLVNEQRLKAGKSTVGFINPILYDHPEVFFDITAGSNYGCGTSGFTAAKGWDPVTGLGSPNFPKLLDLLMGI